MNTQQNIQLENGGTIWLPPSPTYPNVQIPDMSTPDAGQKYDIGCAYTYNGKAYYYARAVGVCQPGMAPSALYKQTIAYGAVTVAAAVGDETITITVSATDGIAGDGLLAKDYLKGGQVVVFQGTSINDFTRGIIANTAVDSGGGTTVLTLDAPIPSALVATTANAEACSSLFAGVGNSSGVHLTKVGHPMCYTAGSQWLWIQTWGAAWLSPQSGVGVAGAIGNAFRHDGSLEPALTAVTSLISSQPAGFCMFSNEASQAAPFIYLQIAHP